MLSWKFSTVVSLKKRKIKLGTPVIYGFKPTNSDMIKLFNKAKLQRTLTGEISEKLVEEIVSYFGGCDECVHQSQ